MNDQTMSSPAETAGLPMEVGISLPTVMARFTDRETIDAVIAKIASAARAHQPDVTTHKGRDAIRSLAHQVARTKTAIDEAGKSLGEEFRKSLSKIDANRKVMRDELDSLRDEVRAPLTKFEADEEARVKAIEGRRQQIQTITLSPRSTVTEIAAEIARIGGLYTGFDFQEQADLAEREYAQSMRRLSEAKSAAEEREAMLAQLEQQRADQERARAEMDRVRREQEAEAAALRAELETAQRERLAAEQTAEAERLAREDVERQAAAVTAIMEAARAEAANAAPSVPALEAEVRTIAGAQGALIRPVIWDQTAAEPARPVLVEHVAAATRDEVRAEILAALRGKSLNQIVDAILDGQIPHLTVKWENRA